MSISTYFKPNIHQNSPEILGVNGLLPSPLEQKYGEFGQQPHRDTIAECSWCQPVDCSAAN